MGTASYLSARFTKGNNFSVLLAWKSLTVYNGLWLATLKKWQFCAFYADSRYICLHKLNLRHFSYDTAHLHLLHPFISVLKRVSVSYFVKTGS